MLLVACTCLLVGCASEEEIATYRVPKERSGLEAFRDQPAFDPMAEIDRTPEPARMLVAMFDQDPSNWFFKVTGSPEKVVENLEQIRSFFDSITFDESGEPEWVTPDGWTVGPPRMGREATLIIDQKVQPPLELAITKLVSGQDLLLNANRWLNQVSLGPITADQLAETLPEITTGKSPYYLFDETGTGTGTMGRPPFAPFAQGASPPSTPAMQSPPAPAPSGPTFTVPEGWISGSTSSIVVARMKKLFDDEDLLEMTLIKMPADRNDWQPNVVRWLGQVGLDWDEDTITQKTQTLTVDGVTGQQIRIIDDEAEKGILGGMVKHDSYAWFIKMSGPREAVAACEADFQAFAESIEF